MVNSQQQLFTSTPKLNETWFPRAITPPCEPKLRTFCFAGAGMESSIWTSTGTTMSPMPNPFCEFATKDAVHFYGVQMPFRGMRRKDPHPGTIQEAARMAMEAIRPLIMKGNCPYVLMGYSMGAWIAYEVLCLAKKEGLPLPVHLIVAAMVSPNLPKALRPWKCTATLDTSGFQNQLRAWNCNEVLFQKDMWAAYEPLLRADHNMLDLYEYTDMNGVLDVCCSIFRGKQDQQLTDESLFQGWFEVLGQKEKTQKNSIIAIEGDHGLVFDSNNRREFFNRVVDILDSVLLGIEYGQ